MMTTLPGPWLSPAVVMRNACPNEFPAMNGACPRLAQLRSMWGILTCGRVDVRALVSLITATLPAGPGTTFDETEAPGEQ